MKASASNNNNRYIKAFLSLQQYQRHSLNTSHGKVWRPLGNTWKLHEEHLGHNWELHEQHLGVIWASLCCHWGSLGWLFSDYLQIVPLPSEQHIAIFLDSNDKFSTTISKIYHIKKENNQKLATCQFGDGGGGPYWWIQNICQNGWSSNRIY